MLMSLKVGGYAIFTTRVEYLTKYGYGPYIENLEQCGRWKKVKQETHIKYDKSDQIEGMSRFSKNEVFCYAFQKL